MIILVSSVALVEQEAASIRLSHTERMTLVLDLIVESGMILLLNGSYCPILCVCLIRLNFASGKGRFIISHETW